MASRSLAGASLLRTSDVAGHRAGLSTSKRVPTEVVRVFKPDDSATAAQNVGSLRAEAASNGWLVDAADQPTSFRAAKAMAFGRAQLVVSTNDLEKPTTVVVSLTPVEQGE